jgi:hypothetical protein
MALDIVSKLKDDKDAARRAEEERNVRHATAIAYIGETWLSILGCALTIVYRRCGYG